MADTAYTVNDHFKDTDKALLGMYNTLISIVRESGPFTQEAKKTSIHFVNHTALAGVRVRKAYLLLNLKSDHEIKSKRIHKSERISASRYHHELKIQSPDDFDPELKGWIKEAYELSKCV